MLEEVKEIMNKKWDANKARKPWSLTLNGKRLSKNTLFIGKTLPDFLQEDYTRTIFTIIAPDGTVIDEYVRQKTKETLKKYLINMGFQFNARSGNVKDKVRIINGIIVKVVRVKGLGYSIVIDKRSSADIDRDTLIVRNFLENKGVMIDNDDICPAYCLIKENKNVI
jgi:hypothetical protein